jgi:hypothetical protein
MTKALKTLRQTLPNQTKIFARSIHYNPLNRRIQSCPPQDWRSPPVLDGYNTIISRVCKELGQDVVTYIDTGFFVSPIWDSGPDWNHVHPRATSSEALYIVSVALGA